MPLTTRELDAHADALEACGRDLLALADAARQARTDGELSPRERRQIGRELVRVVRVHLPALLLALADALD